ncbi:MAG TPA: sn-glycerol-3-phosphate ABC transporter permease UgpE [Geminicoccaceae bacterium]|nr:sn-glycerol-3-phosphate ABC transporter permease UgpE [Geminicoccaceae bacterium]
MVENRPLAAVLAHAVLALGVLVVAFPIYVAFTGSTQTLPAVLQAPMPLLPGSEAVANYRTALTAGTQQLSGTPVGLLLFNSIVLAVGVAVGKIAISILSAFAIVYFRFPGRMLAFWTIFLTLMLPVEVRILPTYAVVADLGLLNSYTGLILPLIASATATFLFRQFFLTVPDELAEAARIDGAGPLKFFKDILLPLSRTNIAALFVILFIYGWNQYLWPLLITTRNDMNTIVIAIGRMIKATDDAIDWPVVMATVMLAMIPPVAVVVLMQRWFVRGLIESEK